MYSLFANAEYIMQALFAQALQKGQHLLRETEEMDSGVEMVGEISVAPVGEYGHDVAALYLRREF